MEVWISVNEADIANIHVGQAVNFTVDAYPGQEFHGKVQNVRLNASMTQNVVTYVVEVSTDNSDGKLLPYLTANARFEVANRQNVLLVPNAALRWSPRPNEIASGSEGAQHKHAAPGETTSSGEPGVVWAPEDGKVRAVSVTVGGSDGLNTEVSGEGLTEDLEVVTGESTPTSSGGGAQSASGTTNPFAPTMPRGGGARR
jgi:HlyD family secretion protein